MTWPFQTFQKRTQKASDMANVVFSGALCSMVLYFYYFPKFQKSSLSTRWRQHANDATASSNQTSFFSEKVFQKNSRIPFKPISRIVICSLSWEHLSQFSLLPVLWIGKILYKSLNHNDIEWQTTKHTLTIQIPYLSGFQMVTVIIWILDFQKSENIRNQDFLASTI